MEWLKKLFGQKKTELKENKKYRLAKEELKWVSEKIIYNKKRYVKRTSEETWLDLAVLHYIVSRLNFERLNSLIPRPLSEYEGHYFYEAAMLIKAEVQRKLEKENGRNKSK